MGHALTRVEMLGEKRQRGAYPEDDGEEMDELARKTEQRMFAIHLLDVVGSEFGPATHRLVRSKAGCRRLEARKSLLSAEAMYVHVLALRQPAGPGSGLGRSEAISSGRQAVRRRAMASRRRAPKQLEPSLCTRRRLDRRSASACAR
jgi:hypothetical protein